MARGKRVASVIKRWAGCLQLLICARSGLSAVMPVFLFFFTTEEPKMVLRAKQTHAIDNTQREWIIDAIEKWPERVKICHDAQGKHF